MPCPGTRIGAAAAGLTAAAASLIVGSAPAGYPAATVTATPSASKSTEPLPWAWAPCATGEFTDVYTDADRNTVISASVSICGTWKEKFSFTLAGFWPGRGVSVVPAGGMRKYNPTGPTPVQGAVRAAPPAGELGVCSLRSQTVRIACVRVTFQPTGPTTMEPIPVDDPLVATAVVSIEPPIGEPIWGFCATCVQLP